MATQKVISGNAQKLGDSGTIMQGGNVSATSRITKNLGIEYVGYRSGRAGTTLPSPLSDATIAANYAGDPQPDAATGRSRNPTYKPYSAGTFGYMASGKYVAKKLSVTLSGVSNTVLYTGASDFGYKRGGVNKVEAIRTSFLRVFTWTADSQSGPTYSATYSTKNLAQNSYKDDDVARASRAVPGELAYLYGPKTPKQDDYKARTT